MIRKARQFEGVAKNKGVIKDFMEQRAASALLPPATYGSSEVFEVRILRSFKDRIFKSYRRKIIHSLLLHHLPLFAEGVERSLPMQKLLKSFFWKFCAVARSEIRLANPERPLTLLIS